MPFGKRGEHKSRLFELMYDDTCANCAEEMLAGDRAGYAEDELVCEECWKEAG